MVAKALLPKFQKANKQGKSRVGDRAANAPIISRTTPSGIITGEMLGDMDNFPEMENTMNLMIRGLYRVESGTILPQDVSVDMVVLNFSLYERIVELFEIPALPPFKTLGPSVFRWQALGIGLSDDSSGWIMLFYDAIPVIGMTGHPLNIPKRPPRVVDPLLAKPRGKRPRILRDIRELGLVEVPPKNPLDFLYELRGRYPTE